MRIYVGHDGTIIRLVSGLGGGKLYSNDAGTSGSLKWPAFGSEVSIEARIYLFSPV